MATVVGSVAGGAWNTNGAWLLGVQPTAADDVQLNATVGNISIPTATTVVCRSLDCTGYTGTLTFASTTAALTIGDSGLGASSIALKFVAGMTLTLTGIGTINFISTNGTQQTIATGGKTLPGVTFNGVSGSWLNSDALTSSGGLNITNGTWDTGNFAISATAFGKSSTGTCTWSPGSSAISFSTAGSAMNVTQPANFTVSSNTAVVTASGSSANFILSTTNYNGMSFVATGGGTIATTGTPTGIANWTHTGTAQKTGSATFAGNLVISGTYTVTTTSVTNRILISSSVVGTAITISAATFTATSSVLEFEDITVSGAATWTVAGSGATALGDYGGNTGITFTTPTTRYGVVATSWSSTGMWATSSGGSAGASVPLGQDNIILDASSAAGTYTIDMPRPGKDITCTGFTRTLLTSVTFSIFGSITLSSGMTFSDVNSGSLTGRGSQTITSAGKSFNNLTIIAFGGTYQLQDAMNNVGSITQLNGTFDTNNFSLTLASGYAATGVLTRSLLLGTSTVTLTVISGTPWQLVATNLTLSALSSTIVISSVSTTARVFSGGGLNYGTLTYTVANSPGGLQITGTNNYIDTLNVGNSRALTIPSNSTNIKNFNVAGVNSGYQRLNSGGVSGHYVAQPDSTQLSFAGDFTLRYRGTLDDWTPTAINALVGKYGAVGNRSYMLSVDTAGKLNLSVSNNGTAVTVAVSSVATGFTDGTNNNVLATWRTSDGRVQFYTASGAIAAPIPSDYTQLGTNQTANVGTLFDSTALVEYGSVITGTFNFLTGNMYRAQIYDGLFDGTTQAGTLQADVNFVGKTLLNSVTASTFLESSANAATVTITGALALVGDGRITLASASGGSPAFLSLIGPVSTNDYLTVQDVLTMIPYKFYAGANSISVSGNTGVVFTAKVTQLYIYKEVENGTAGTTTNSQVATFPFSQSAVAGNMLVIAYSTTAAPGAVTTPAGYTLIDSSLLAGGVPEIFTFYKVAAGGETSVTIATGNSVLSNFKFFEIGGFTGTATFDVKDKNSVSANTALSTAGSGASNTASPAIAVAFWEGSASLGATVSYTNSFQEERGQANTGANMNFLRAAALPLNSTGSVSSTLTWTTSRNAVTQLVVFKDVVAAAGGSVSNLMLMGVG